MGKRLYIDPERFASRVRQMGFRSMSAVAEAAGIHKSRLSRYLRGLNEVPYSAMAAIARVLQTSVTWLSGEDELVPMAVQEASAQRRKVPIAGIIPASRRDASLPSQGPLDFVSLPEGVVADEALEVRNGCMSPGIREGDIIFIRKADVAVPGRIYVLEVNDTGERTLKRCQIYKGRIRFVADNPEYADALYSLQEVRVLAEVVAWLHRERG